MSVWCEPFEFNHDKWWWRNKLGIQEWPWLDASKCGDVELNVSYLFLDGESSKGTHTTNI